MHGEPYAVSKWAGVKTKDVRARLGEPEKDYAGVAKAMFTDAWEMQRKHVVQVAESVKRGIVKADSEIAKLLDRIVSASNDSVVAAYDLRDVTTGTTAQQTLIKKGYCYSCALRLPSLGHALRIGRPHLFTAVNTKSHAPCHAGGCDPRRQARAAAS